MSRWFNLDIDNLGVQLHNGQDDVFPLMTLILNHDPMFLAVDGRLPNEI
jgi:hypothetical protein